MFAIKGSKILWIGLLSLVLVAGWRLSQDHSTTSVFEPSVQALQSELLCPWREPGEDLRVLFPKASRYKVETLILSGLRTQLSKQLGRAPTGDENALHVYRVYAEQEPLGVIMTRRVKGTYGAIELVLGVELDGRVRGLRIQREREPERIATSFQRPDWLASFAGKQADSPFKLGVDVPAVAPDAQASAEAIVQGTQSLLILLGAAGQAAHASTTVHH